MSESIIQDSNIKTSIEIKKKKFFQLNDKYIVAFILGFISASISVLTSQAIVVIIGSLIAIIYTFYREIKDNDKISKKIIGILIGLLLTPIFFMVSQKLTEAVLTKLLQ